jgi:hypothetical protein
MGKRSAVVELFLGDMGSMQRELRPSIQREDQLTMETKLEQIAVKAVNQLPKSVVREIRTPRSVGAGGGRPPPATRWARGNSRPYRESDWRSAFPFHESLTCSGFLGLLVAERNGPHDVRADRRHAGAEPPPCPGIQSEAKRVALGLPRMREGPMTVTDRLRGCVVIHRQACGLFRRYSSRSRFQRASSLEPMPGL